VGVSLSLNNGVLRAQGEAPVEWITTTSRLAGFVPGVTQFDAAPLVEQSVRSFASGIEATPLLFRNGTSDLLPGEDRRLQQIEDLLRDLDRVAQTGGMRIGVVVVGHTDEVGTDLANATLSDARAQHVLRLLEPSSFPALDFSTEGVGSREQSVSGRTEAEKQQNRRVSLRVRTAPTLPMPRPVDGKP
jgi:OOP family OmpA-OmpF porin